MIITDIEACCHHKPMFSCRKKVCMSNVKHQKDKISWKEKNGKKNFKEEDEMKVNIDEIERKKEKVPDFLFISYEITLMTRPDLRPTHSPRLLFFGYRVSSPVGEEDWALT
jgi:hypothetical protein